MSLDKSYQQLFTSLQEIVDAEPNKAAQLLAVIMAGGPFRPFLDKPELMSKVVVMAKQYVADKKKGAVGAAPRPAAMPASTTGSRRVVSVRDVTPQRGPSKV